MPAQVRGAPDWAVNRRVVALAEQRFARGDARSLSLCRGGAPHRAAPALGGVSAPQPGDRDRLVPVESGHLFAAQQPQCPQHRRQAGGAGPGGQSVTQRRKGAKGSDALCGFVAWCEASVCGERGNASLTRRHKGTKGRGNLGQCLGNRRRCWPLC